MQVCVNRMARRGRASESESDRRAARAAWIRLRVDYDLSHPTSQDVAVAQNGFVPPFRVR